MEDKQERNAAKRDHQRRKRQRRRQNARARKQEQQKQEQQAQQRANAAPKQEVTRVTHEASEEKFKQQNVPAIAQFASEKTLESSTKTSEEDAGLSAYEAKRRRRIEENRRVLLSLKIPTLVRPRAAPRPKKVVNVEPVRRSKRQAALEVARQERGWHYGGQMLVKLQKKEGRKEKQQQPKPQLKLEQQSSEVKRNNVPLIDLSVGENSLAVTVGEMLGDKVAGDKGDVKQPSNVVRNIVQLIDLSVGEDSALVTTMEKTEEKQRQKCAMERAEQQKEVQQKVEEELDEVMVNDASLIDLSVGENSSTVATMEPTEDKLAGDDAKDAVKQSNEATRNNAQLIDLTVSENSSSLTTMEMTEGKSSGTGVNGDKDGIVNEYEAKRQRRIEENRRMLQALNIEKFARPKTKPRPKQVVKVEPVRRSSRHQFLCLKSELETLQKLKNKENDVQKLMLLQDKKKQTLTRLQKLEEEEQHQLASELKNLHKVGSIEIIETVLEAQILQQRMQGREHRKRHSNGDEDSEEDSGADEVSEQYWQHLKEQVSDQKAVLRTVKDLEMVYKRDGQELHRRTLAKRQQRKEELEKRKAAVERAQHQAKVEQKSESQSNMTVQKRSSLIDLTLGEDSPPVTSLDMMEVKPAGPDINQKRKIKASDRLENQELKSRQQKQKKQRTLDSSQSTEGEEQKAMQQAKAQQDLLLAMLKNPPLIDLPATYFCQFSTQTTKLYVPSSMLRINADAIHEKFLGTQILPAGKQAVMEGLCPIGYAPQYVVENNVQPWKDAVVLFMDDEGSASYDKMFCADEISGRKVVYFDWNKEERWQGIPLEMLRRLKQMQRGDERLHVDDSYYGRQKADKGALDMMFLFVKHRKGPYIYCGRLGYLGEFRWQLVDVNAFNWERIHGLLMA